MVGKGWDKNKKEVMEKSFDPLWQCLVEGKVVWADNACFDLKNMVCARYGEIGIS